MTTEPKFKAIIKASGDHGAPWLTVNGDDATELELNLQAVEQNTTFATMGRLTTNFAAQYNVGKGLGAQGVNAPQSAPAPQYSGGSMAAAQPTPAYAPAPPAASAAPAGVPLVCGIPAKWIDKGNWKAWADPRPQHETGPEKLKTDDENHPGLAGGSHKFWRFVR